mgnify:CR=1 FL=1
MSFIFLSLVIQALLIVHCIKTGRNQIWIWVLALLSYAGIIAYVAAELVPELLRSRTTQRTVKGVKKTLDPEADLRVIIGGEQCSQPYASASLAASAPTSSPYAATRAARNRVPADCTKDSNVTTWESISPTRTVTRDRRKFAPARE